MLVHESLHRVTQTKGSNLQPRQPLLEEAFGGTDIWIAKGSMTLPQYSDVHHPIGGVMTE